MGTWEWTPANITAMSAAIVAFITAFSTKGVNAIVLFMRYMDERRAAAVDLECDEEEVDDNKLKYVIRYQARRIKKLEDECDKLEIDVKECREDRAALRVEFALLKSRVDRLNNKLSDPVPPPKT